MINKGDKVLLTENLRISLSIEDNLEFEVIDIIETNSKNKFILSNKKYELEYINEDEIIKN